MRVTENMKFNTAIASLGSVQGQYNSLLEKMASQKRINRISDDPLGMTMLLNYRQGQAEIEQYQKNIDNSNGWLGMTETKLTSARDLLVQAKELALTQGTDTASVETRRIAADNVQQLKEEMLALANSSYGGRYLFAGSRTDVTPFSATYQAARLDAPVPAASSSFAGTVLASGTYNAAGNKTYAMRVVQGGALGAATYQLSADGGKTWDPTAQTVPNTGVISLGDGVNLTFTESAAPGAPGLTDGDMFSVNAFAAGYYQGNSGDLTIDIGKDASVSYNITGSKAFSGEDGGEDVFAVLDSLKAALLSNDSQLILAQLEKLTTANSQVNFAVSRVGTTMNRMDVAASNLQDLKQQLTDMTSKTEDADMAALATSLAMKQIALQASYATAAKIGSNTILNFIK